MRLQKKVRRVGGSLGLFLPRDVALLVGIKEGTTVDFIVEGDKISISVAKSQSRKIKT